MCGALESPYSTLCVLPQFFSASPLIPATDSSNNIVETVPHVKLHYLSCILLVCDSGICFGIAVGASLEFTCVTEKFWKFMTHRKSLSEGEGRMGSCFLFLSLES